MQPAVSTVLGRAIGFPGLTAWDVFGNSQGSCEVSNRTESQIFGCRWSPQQAESLATVGGKFPLLNLQSSLTVKKLGQK